MDLSNFQNIINLFLEKLKSIFQNVYEGFNKIAFGILLLIFVLSIIGFIIFLFFLKIKSTYQKLMDYQYEKSFLNLYDENYFNEPNNILIPTLPSSNLILEFTNTITNKNEPTTLSHFYYLGSYLTGLIGGVSYANINKQSIQKIIQKGIRVFHFMIFSNNNKSLIKQTSSDKEPRNESLEPILRTPILSEYFSSNVLAWKEVIPIFEDYVWFERKDEPCFLYLELTPDVLKNEILMKKTFEPLLKSFGNKLAPLKYGFCGRNGIYPLSKAPMKDIKGKLCILTNIYPTNTIYDEFIHGCFQPTNAFCPTFLYKHDYYSSSQDIKNAGFSLQIADHLEFIQLSSQSLMGTYPEIVKNINNIYTPFLDIQNYNVSDPAQYGVSVLMIQHQYPDIGLQKTYQFFKKGPIIIKPKNQNEYDSMNFPENTWDATKEKIFWENIPLPTLKPHNEENNLALKKVSGLNGYYSITI